MKIIQRGRALGGWGWASQEWEHGAGSSWCFDPALEACTDRWMWAQLPQTAGCCYFKLRSAGLEQSCSLASVQPRRAVLLLVDLSLRGLKAKQGLHCPVPLGRNPVGRVGTGAR